MTTSPVPSTTLADPSTAAARPRLFIAGLGSVGGALLRQLRALPDQKATPHVAGVCTSRRTAWYDTPRPADTVDPALSEGASTNWATLLKRLERAAQDDAARPLVFVDATGSVEVARYHARLLEAGCSIVTPSKHALTQEQAYFDRLQATVAKGSASYHFETTVGAGLPVVRTLRDLQRTGDHIRSIRGAASGTLSFLFSQLRTGEPFSAAVRAAIERGYAEPDVREDLSGEDVARKFLILGRTLGLKLERENVTVESLVPEALRDAPLDHFLDALPQLDAEWTQRTQQARTRGEVLQYVGRLTDGHIRVAVENVAADAPFGLLSGTDNLFAFRTARYDTAPLSVRGPGAGPDVTAAGVLNDVFEATRPPAIR